ncbi:hypothetical protein [Halosimplex pelagicum]|uniref:Uncharacterized protein n=1 Tax=Halosimplex pelagicum TaxID=869886 RepID=A0A7D5T1X0_9EURY|nr:hypothetical protein [Halosimplex pelagicum]QLH80731.1 hypothetical protein HZS54_03370 [Halosimplex pelagicum]
MPPLPRDDALAGSGDGDAASDGDGDGDRSGDGERATAADRRSGVSRRRVLRGVGGLGASAVGAGAVAGASGVASAQITQAAAIPEVARWENENLAGFMIHVGGSTSPTQVRVAEGCVPPGSDTWPPDEMLAYDAMVINRKLGDTPEAETTLYIGGSVEVLPGQLYLISRFNRCDDGFVGVSLEQIGRSDVSAGPGQQATNRPVADVEEDERPRDLGTTQTPDATGPGFGLLASFAGLLGGGALLRRRDDE